MRLFLGEELKDIFCFYGAEDKDINIYNIWLKNGKLHKELIPIEDISDRLATTSAYNALISVQNEILSSLTEGILIFGSNGRLNFYNDAYIKLWNAKKTFLAEEPTFDEILDSQKSFFSDNSDWDSLKKGISANILNMTSKTLTLKRSKKSDLLLSVKHLSDGSLLIVYKNIE